MIAMEPFRSRKASIPILDQVRDYCARHGLIEYGDRILLAVSGGPDSTAMLHMLHGLRLEYDLGLGVAHVHHGLRGFDADKDLRFVKGMARELDLPFYATKVQVLSQRNRCESLEEAARRLRYQFLLNTLQEMDYTRMAFITALIKRMTTGVSPEIGYDTRYFPCSSRSINVTGNILVTFQRCCGGRTHCWTVWPGRLCPLFLSAGTIRDTGWNTIGSCSLIRH